MEEVNTTVQVFFVDMGRYIRTYLMGVSIHGMDGLHCHWTEQ